MLTKIQRNIGISEFRGKLAKYFRDAEKGPLIVTMDRGKNQRVLITATLYNMLLHVWSEQAGERGLEQDFELWDQLSDDALVAMEQDLGT